jgi:predicted RNase H-like HicB family nuclease
MKTEPSMLTRFIETAMKHANDELLNEDDGFYGHIPELPGVLATGSTVEACAIELQEVLEDWISLGLAMQHEFPTIDGITIGIHAAA